MINYAPFPPELLNPRSGGNLTPVNGTIILSWNCTDVDNDLDSFEIYLDNLNATTLIKSVPYETLTTEIEVNVENGKNYYWLTGKFINLDKGKDTDQWALSNGYVSIVPTMYDMTSYPEIDEISKWNLK